MSALPMIAISFHVFRVMAILRDTSYSTDLEENLPRGRGVP
jgi:hypothetical protein